MRRFLTLLAAALIISMVALYVNHMRIPSVRMLTASAESLKSSNHPVARGTFIQWWLVRDWDDERWLKEYHAMKEVGMEYLILTPTAFSKVNENTGAMRVHTIYPTRDKKFKALDEGIGAGLHDVVDACLRNASKMGVKVFLGLNFSDLWWEKRLDAEWVFDRVEEGNRVADELWDLYHEKYPDAFYGWYWCWEADNGNFRALDLNNSKKLLADAIQLQLAHLENTGKRLPFMIAPFMDWKLSTPQGYADVWKYVFARSGMKEGDIFAPQDSIGAGGLTLENYTKWFEELRKAVDSKPGIELWANVETFDVKDWTGAPLDRFVRQMKDLVPFVHNFVTFSYSHYYSPNVVDEGFHKTYSGYVNSGMLEVEAPETPRDFKADLQSDGKVRLSWKASSDNVGVCGYYILRDGRRIANLQVKRNNGASSAAGLDAETSMIDSGLEQGKTYIYEAQAYDFAGNLSEKAGPITVAIP